MQKLEVNMVGLALGGFFALMHAIWSLLVLVGGASAYMDFILGLHFVNLSVSIDPFSFGTALLLVIVTGAIGYVVGVIFATLWNLAHSASHK